MSDFDFHRFALAEGRALDLAQAMMRAGQAEDAIPIDRPDLTGSEEAFFAWSGKQLAGCAVFYAPEGDDCLFVDVLYVEPQFRRQGMARKMLNLVHHRAGCLNLPKVMLGTLPSNDAMQTLAVSAGFTASAIYMTRAAE